MSASLDFQDACILRTEAATSGNQGTGAELGFSRAYSLALSPQIIYSRSALLPTLVSSKVHHQLEFLAVGAWWIFHGDAGRPAADDAASGSLKRIPGGREDIFADKSIDFKAKRSLMRFLQTIADAEAHARILAERGDQSFEEYVSSEFGISGDLVHTLHALTLSPHSARKTAVFFALPRITRHLSSIGLFGPGFSAVIPKWGGLSEISQVSCRACAVGGGVYMLSKGFEKLEEASNGTISKGLATVQLTGGESVQTSKLVDQVEAMLDRDGTEAKATYTARGISIVASLLPELFPPITEGGTTPSACTVVVFPETSLQIEGDSLPCPVYLFIHSSDTGECPNGQCKSSGPLPSQLNYDDSIEYLHYLKQY